MERLTRPGVAVDPTAAKFIGAEVKMQHLKDRLLELILNGPTVNAVNKGVLRSLIRQLYDALERYEDIGLEPEEIVDLRKQNSLLAQYGAQKFDASMEDFKEINTLKLKIQSLEMGLKVACDTLEKFKKAEQEGRLVVLPCRVGDRVYISGHRFPAQIEEVVINASDGITVNWAEYDRGPEETELWDDGWFTPDDFGKTVFLTREEAEQALAADKNVGSKGGGSDA